MKVSVCMGLYNGAKYIEEQLRTILYQTHEPDEVILCDDISTDDTVKLVQNFIEENQLNGKWKLYVNDKNKGYPTNFYYAMSLCTGDIVFLSDQDDIWHEKKLEKMLEIFTESSTINAVSCKFGLVDVEGNRIHTAMTPTKSEETGNIRGVTAEEVFYKCEWPGMVLAYRNEWYQERTARGRLQTERVKIPHDFLVCAMAAEEDGFRQLDAELAYHRRHDSNTGGEEHRLGKLLNKRRKLREIEDYLFILNQFEEKNVLETNAGKEALQRKLVSMKGRYEALKSGKIAQVLQNAVKNRRNVRLVTVLCDVVIVKQK